MTQVRDSFSLYAHLELKEARVAKARLEMGSWGEPSSRSLIWSVGNSAFNPVDRRAISHINESCLTWMSRVTYERIRHVTVNE